MLTQVKRQNQDANPGMSDSESRLLPSVRYCLVKLVNSQCHCHALSCLSWVLGMVAIIIQLVFQPSLFSEFTFVLLLE